MNLFKKIKNFDKLITKDASEIVLFILPIVLWVTIFFSFIFLLDVTHNFEGVFRKGFVIISWILIILVQYWAIRGLNKISKDRGESEFESGNRFSFFVWIGLFFWIPTFFLFFHEEDKTMKFQVTNSEESGVEECELYEYSVRDGEDTYREYELNCY
jgi:hypothetical protein